MKKMILTPISLLFFWASSASAEQSHYLAVGFGEQEKWHMFADEPWWTQVDMRDMLNIFHPHSLPKTGNAAGASRDATIPNNWQPPFALRFYCSDDYAADSDKQKPGKVGTESFFEHRYKQVLIGDQLVWERDVIDENTMGSPTVFEVDVTPYVKPGTSFKMTFRAFDKISTEQRNDRDVWFRTGTWYAPGDGKTEQPPRFHTAVWFADPVIGEKQAVQNAPAASRPHDDIVQAHHRQRWPRQPRALPMKLPAALKLVTPTTIPASGFPITCGVPMPPGLMKTTDRIVLEGANDESLPLQCTTGATWPDNSVRHLIVNTIAPAGAKNEDLFKLDIVGNGPPIDESPLIIQKNDKRVIVNTGKINIVLGSSTSHLIDEVRLAENTGPVFTKLTARMSLGDETGSQPGENVPARSVEAAWQEIKVVEEGRVAARIELYGTLVSGDQHIGRFVFRLYAYAGLPQIQTQFRIINDVNAVKPLQVADLALVATLPGGTQQIFAGIENGDPVQSDVKLALHQQSHDRFAVNDGKKDLLEGKHAQGWMTASTPKARVHAAVRWFWQQHPKALSADDGGLEIGLFAPTEKNPFYLPNFAESKRHDIWFTFSDPSDPKHDRKGVVTSGAAIGALADSPPRFFDSAWFCQSGAYAVLDPNWFENQPKIAKWVKDAYGDISSTSVRGHYGIRDFGDFPHHNDDQGLHWMNGYWAMIQGSLYWGLAGDPRWIERSNETARHIVDVDCVRIPAGHVDWENWHGVMCALGIDHSQHKEAARWPAFQQGDNLFLHYWMTGDPDTREAAIANADYLVRSKAGVGSTEARSQARPMITLLRAWQATSDSKYLDAAKRYLDLKSQIERVIEWRRGAYIQPTYENWRCVSAGLNSMYAHNIYDYYRLTGDIDAARLVVAVADSIYAESMLPQEEGIGSFLFYVRYSRGSWYYTQMAMLFYMAYDLTGDVRFLRAGRAAFERYLHCTFDGMTFAYQNWINFGWLDPEFGGWLQEFKDIETKPFTITGQTPDPDPARYN